MSSNVHRSTALFVLFGLVLIIGYSQVRIFKEPHSSIVDEEGMDVFHLTKQNSRTAVDDFPDAGNGSDSKSEESKKAFLDAYTVFMHPRCMNCHPTGDIPLQGDDSHLHTQGVVRGVDGKGVYANKCSNCHQPTPIEGLHLPPSLPTWHLPTAHRKMVFEGQSPRELAMSFKDSSFTGFATVERLIEHVETDPLVRHGFTYGTRPPLSHEEFVSRVKEWIEKGAVVPD